MAGELKRNNKNEQYLIYETWTNNKIIVQELLPFYDGIASASVYKIYQVKKEIGSIQNGTVRLTEPHKKINNKDNTFILAPQYLIVDSHAQDEYVTDELLPFYNHPKEATVYRMYRITRGIGSISNNKLYQFDKKSRDTQMSFEAKSQIWFFIFFVLFVLVVLLISANQ